MVWPKKKKGWYHIAFQKRWADHLIHTVLVTVLRKISFLIPNTGSPLPLVDVRTLWVGLFSSLIPWIFLSIIPFAFELLCKFSLSPSITHLVSFGALGDTQLHFPSFQDRFLLNCLSSYEDKNRNTWKLKGREFGGPIIKVWGTRNFPGGPEVKNPPANAGDMGLIPGLGESHMPWSS